MMIIIVWNPINFHIVDVLSKGSKFNAHHYVSAILQYLTDWRIGEVGATDRKLIIHTDNVRFHPANVLLAFIKQNEMKRTPRPPYSQISLPSTFFLSFFLSFFLYFRSY
jgi:hypothetical protein